LYKSVYYVLNIKDLKCSLIWRKQKKGTLLVGMGAFFF